jgi:uracil-DNA glycosylase family 4
MTSRRTLETWVEKNTAYVKACGAECSKCPLARDGKPYRPVLAEGPTDAAGVLVGEGPSRDDSERGRPFVGVTGQQLEDELLAAGLQRVSLSLVYATACMPPPGRTDQAMQRAVKACAPVFRAQLPAGKHVLAMGRWSAFALVGQSKGVMNTRGFIRPLPDGMSFITTWAPMYALFRNPYEWGSFRIDIERFARLLRGQTQPDARFILKHPKAHHVRKLHRWALRTGEPISCDIETAPEHPDLGFTGKDPTRAKLSLLGLGCRLGGMAIHWRRADAATKQAAVALLADKRVTIDGQNFDWFDLRVLARYGIRVSNLFDTRDARRALSATSPLSLAYLTSLYYDAHPWKEIEESEEKGAQWQKPEYNAYDCFYTSHVAAGLRAEPEWKSSRVQRIYGIQREKARIAAEMHTHGLYVNQERRAFMAWALMEEYKEKEKLLLGQVKLDGFDANPNHMRALIFQKHATGKYAHLARYNLPDPIDPAMYVDEKELDTISVDEDSLTLLLIDPDVPDELKATIKLYWDAQTTWKSRSTFLVSKKVEQAIGRDNRLRAGWNSCGTDTGRFACSEPNMMNVPQELRHYIEAPPGYVMIGADYSQLELRVRAAVMQDRLLAEHLKGDVYSENAKIWFGLPADMDVKRLKPGARKASKIIHLACQYAAGLKTVHSQALQQDRNMKFELTAGLFNGFRRTYSDTVLFWEEEHKRVCQLGYSESRILNRRRLYPREPPPTETANFPIQGTAADVVDIAMLELDRRLKAEVPRAQIVVQLHDAFYVYVPEKQSEQTVEILKECMEQEFTIEGRKYVFPTEIKVAHPLDGKTWGDL